MSVWLAAWDWFSSHGLEIIAIAISPLVALQVSTKLERDRDEKNRKLYILQTLLATRHAPFSDDRIRALNAIDVLFPNDVAVRGARRELMKSLSKPEGLRPDGVVPSELLDEWNERQWELVSEIAQVLRVPITKDDFASGYAPKAISDMLGQQLLTLETNKSLIMFARNQLGLPWNPAALFHYPDGVGIVGPYKEVSIDNKEGKPSD